MSIPIANKGPDAFGCGRCRQMLAIQGKIPQTKASIPRILRDAGTRRRCVDPLPHRNATESMLRLQPSPSPFQTILGLDPNLHDSTIVVQRAKHMTAVLESIRSERMNHPIIARKHNETPREQAQLLDGTTSMERPMPRNGCASLRQRDCRC